MTSSSVTHTPLLRPLVVFIDTYLNNCLRESRLISLSRTPAIEKVSALALRSDLLKTFCCQHARKSDHSAEYRLVSADSSLQTLYRNYITQTTLFPLRIPTRSSFSAAQTRMLFRVKITVILTPQNNLERVSAELTLAPPVGNKMC